MQWQSSWCLLTIFLSASLGDAFVNHARLNHLIRFQQPMSDPTNEPSREPINEPTNDRMNDQTTHGMNEQTEVPLQQSGTHANSIDSWQCQMEINKVKSNKREPITSHSSIKRDKSTPTFQLVVASVSNKREPIASHSSIKYLLTSQVPPFWAELVRASSKTAQRAIGSKCKSLQSCGHCHDKKSEQVGNRASTQLMGSCHNKKSEQVGNPASTQTSWASATIRNQSE